MNLLTHNFLSSNVKGVKKPYPLQLRADEVEHDTKDFDREATVRLIPRIDYNALVLACRACKYDALPDKPPGAPEDNEEFLRVLHNALFNVQVVRGALICGESGRNFPIDGGIPNMVLNEEEIV